MPQNFNDMLDHVVTALLALLFGGGLFVLQLQQGTVPDWAVGALGTILGFYFRGRVNGQFNSSQMSRLQAERNAAHRLDSLEETRRDDTQRTPRDPSH